MVDPLGELLTSQTEVQPNQIGSKHFQEKMDNKKGKLGYSKNVS